MTHGTPRDPAPQTFVVEVDLVAGAAASGEPGAPSLVETVLTNSPDVVVVADGDGTVRFCGPNVRHMFGVAVDDVVGTNVFDHIHPDDHELAAAAFAGSADQKADDEPLVRIRHADSSWRLVAATGRRATGVPGRQLHDEDLADLVEALVDQHRIAPGRLVLEITEQAMITDVAVATDVLTRLRQLGVMVALDDFGTGYSSLAYLHRLPVDIVKIDREFVAVLDAAERPDRSLVAAVIALTRSLDLQVVAEGVETAEQAAILETLGCRWLQGYL